MMISTKGKGLISCDSCLFYQEFNTEKITNLIDFEKQYRWKLIWIYGRWVHICPNCKRHFGTIKLILWRLRNKLKDLFK